MKRRSSVYVMNLVLLAMTLSFILAPQSIKGDVKNPGASAVESSQEGFYEQLELFADVVTTIQSDYVDEVESKELMYGALRGMLSSLDKHSQFMDPDLYNEMKVDTEGEFGGLGIEITIRDNLLTIITPIPGTPADKMGLKPNDKVVKIDDEITKDITLIGAVKKLRGKPGTKVKLTILREGERELLEVTIVRDIIKLESIKEAKIVGENIGYVRLIEFRENTLRDFDNALKKLRKQGMEGFILDLRNNPGGLLNSAAKVAQRFLKKGEMVVYTKGRIKSQNIEFISRYRKPYLELPVVVLVNRGSASGSEIVAGALQDNKRAIILGTKTFGKGSVQTVIPLKDGSAIRLTTSKYFTPLGRSIHGEGIMPDVIVEEIEVARSNQEKEKKPDVFDKPDLKDRKESEVEKGKEQDSVEKKEDEAKDVIADNQLARAIDILKGIKVYKNLEERVEKQ